MNLIFKYFIKYRPQLIPSITCIIIGIFSALLKIIGPFLSVLLVDLAFKQKTPNLMIAILLGFFFVYACELITNFLNDYFTTQFNAVISGKIAHAITSKTFQLSIMEQRNIKNGDLFLRINLDSLEVADLITKLFYQVPLDILRYLGFLAAVYSFDGITALLVVSGLPIYAMKSWFYSVASIEVQLQREQRDIEFTEKINEILRNLRNIKVFGAEQFEYDQFLKLWRDRSVANRKLRVISFISVLTTFATIRGFQVLIIGILGYKVIRAELSVGEFVAISALLPNIEEPLRRLSTVYSEFKVGLVSLNRVEEILSNRKTDCEQLKSNLKNDVRIGEITFQDVTFFHTNQIAALNKVSLALKNNSTTAIVGQSGSGKTTLMNLILGFDTPFSGSVKIDGIDIREYSRDLLRSRIGVVFEDIPVFSGTIRDNIIYNHSDISEDDLISAAKMAAAHDSIMQLPNQYDTHLEQGGWNVSSGLVQRIAIARALALKPKILILDDALSAIDSEYALVIQNTLQECKKDMTVIMITNQLSNVRCFDEIVVLDQGRIAEVGKFSKLLNMRGVFSRLYYLQNSGFSEFKRRLEVELQRRERYGKELSVVFIRIFKFPEEIRSLGGNTITKVMKEIECYIRQEIRIMDFCSVFGEDKILIALSDTPDEGALNFIKTIKLKINNHTFNFKDIKFKIDIISELLPAADEEILNPDLIYINALKNHEDANVA